MCILQVKSKVTDEDLTHVRSQLDMKSKQLTKSKEENKLLMKQFHVRKQSKRQQAVIIQVGF